MTRTLLASVALALSALAGSIAPASAEVRFRVDISNAPPPPRVFYRAEPRFVVVPGTRAYWWENASGDYEVYRYGRTYYVLDDGYWYRGSSLRGPFRVVRVAVVPRPIISAVDYHDKSGNWKRGHGRGHAYGHRKRG